jgi:hypothetical protein
MKAQPSPNHKLYVKVGKPNVKRWIMPQADPDPKVWVLAETIEPVPMKDWEHDAKVTEDKGGNAEIEVRLSSKVAQDVPDDLLENVPNIQEKPKAEPKPRPKRAPRKTTPKTKSAE